MSVAELDHVPSFVTPWADPWVPQFIGTLLFVVRGDEVLLIHKKTGHGAGCINGPGGKLQAGESTAECAVRETFEETGIRVAPAAAVCGMEMRCVEEDGPQWLGFAFIARAFEGLPIETDEALPFWCPLHALPLDRMWPDDAIWLPPLLADGDELASPRVGNFLFRDGELLAHEHVDEPSVAGAWDTPEA